MHRLPLFLDLNTNNCLVFILLIHQNIMYDKWQLLVPNMIWEHSGTVAIWTGVADFETESHFVWVASGRDANMYYSNWYIGDSNGSFNENGTEIWTKTLNGDIYWNDLNCYNLRNYACFFSGVTLRFRILTLLRFVKNLHDEHSAHIFIL